MLQNPCKTLGFKKNMVYKIPPGGEVNYIQPVAYITLYIILCLISNGPCQFPNEINILYISTLKQSILV